MVNCRGKSGRRGLNQEISLLGRQGFAETPLARYRLAIEADPTGIPEIHAALTKTFASPRNKVSRPFPDGIQMPRYKISLSA